ncbi:MAG: ribosome-binding factor A [Francisellaceae bacterium]
MATISRRHRVADEIQKTITKTLSREINDPRLKWVSITSVDVSGDLSYAKIYYSSLLDKASQEEMAVSFAKAKGLFRKCISREIKLRITPSISFIYDDSMVYGNKMDDLISKARSADEDLIAQDDSSLDEDHKEESPERKDGRERLR